MNSDLLKGVILSKGMTQANVAESIGVSVSRLNDADAEKKKPPRRAAPKSFLFFAYSKPNSTANPGGDDIRKQPQIILRSNHFVQLRQNQV